MHELRMSSSASYAELLELALIMEKIQRWILFSGPDYSHFCDFIDFFCVMYHLWNNKNKTWIFVLQLLVSLYLALPSCNIIRMRFRAFYRQNKLSVAQKSYKYAWIGCHIICIRLIPISSFQDAANNKPYHKAKKKVFWFTIMS